MDYEVFLSPDEGGLGADGDNTEACQGLDRSGRIVSSAALIVVWCRVVRLRRHRLIKHSARRRAGGGDRRHDRPRLWSGHHALLEVELVAALAWGGRGSLPPPTASGERYDEGDHRPAGQPRRSAARAARRPHVPASPPCCWRWRSRLLRSHPGDARGRRARRPDAGALDAPTRSQCPAADDARTDRLTSVVLHRAPHGGEPHVRFETSCSRERGDSRLGHHGDHGRVGGASLRPASEIGRRWTLARDASACRRLRVQPHRIKPCGRIVRRGAAGAGAAAHRSAGTAGVARRYARPAQAPRHARTMAVGGLTRSPPCSAQPRLPDRRCRRDSGSSSAWSARRRPP